MIIIGEKSHANEEEKDERKNQSVFHSTIRVRRNSCIRSLLHAVDPIFRQAPSNSQDFFFYFRKLIKYFFLYGQKKVQSTILI